MINGQITILIDPFTQINKRIFLLHTLNLPILTAIKNLKTSLDLSPGPSIPQNLPPLSTSYNLVLQNYNKFTEKFSQMLSTPVEMIRQRVKNNNYSMQISTLMKIYREDYKYNGKQT